MYLVISNKGRIDPQALALMGASVKEEEGAIGEFGSGLKYAIARLLREGLSFRIFSGETEINLSVVQSEFRSQSFGVIHINHQPTSITTRTGPKWEIRDAIREIWSNALDEGEAQWGVMASPPVIDPDRTTFVIEMNAEIETMTLAWDQYFLSGQPWIKNSSGEVHKQLTTNFFRRGIWICEDREQIGLFSYNFRQFDLPESRRVTTASVYTSLWWIMGHINEAAYWDALISNVTTPCAEWRALDYIMLSDAEQGLKSAFLRQYDFLGHKSHQHTLTSLPPGRILWLDGLVYQVLAKAQCPKLEEHLGINDKYEIINWPIGVRETVMKEINFLATKGIDLSPYTLRYAKFRDPNTIAMAVIKTETCLISDSALTISPVMLRKALIEEWTHLRHKVADGSVEQQHVYLDLIVELMG